MVLGGETTGGGQLALRDVDSHHAGPTPDQPRRHIPGAAPKLYGIHAGHVDRQQP